MPAIGRASARIGPDALWRGNTLVISRQSQKFLDWEAWLFEGAIIADDAEPGSWGRVWKLSGAVDGSAIWVSVEWVNGLKPLVGTVSFARACRISVDDRSGLAGKSSWESQRGGFLEEKVPSTFGVTSPSGDATIPLPNACLD
jgi:hypothetical protein